MVLSSQLLSGFARKRNELLQASCGEWVPISITCKGGQQGRRGMKCKAPQAAAPASPWRALCSGSGWFHRDQEFKHRSNWIADVFSDGYLLAKLQLKQEQRGRTGRFSVIKLMEGRVAIYSSLHREHNAGTFFWQDFWGWGLGGEIWNLSTDTQLAKPRGPECMLDWKAANSNLNNTQISSSLLLQVFPDEQLHLLSILKATEVCSSWLWF